MLNYHKPRLLAMVICSSGKMTDRGVSHLDGPICGPVIVPGPMTPIDLSVYVEATGIDGNAAVVVRAEGKEVITIQRPKREILKSTADKVHQFLFDFKFKPSEMRPIRVWAYLEGAESQALARELQIERHLGH